MRLSALFSIVAATASLVAGVQGIQPTKTTRSKSKKWDKGFVTIDSSGQFIRNGEYVFFIYTNYILYG